MDAPARSVGRISRPVLILPLPTSGSEDFGDAGPFGDRNPPSRCADRLWIAELFQRIGTMFAPIAAELGAAEQHAQHHTVVIVDEADARLDPENEVYSCILTLLTGIILSKTLVEGTPQFGVGYNMKKNQRLCWPHPHLATLIYKHKACLKQRGGQMGSALDYESKLRSMIMAYHPRDGNEALLRLTYLFALVATADAWLPDEDKIADLLDQLRK